MEATFYEDLRSKRPASLDLDSPCKRPRVNAILSSPELQMLKLESPELEKLLIQQHSQPCMYPQKGGDQYARDFADALGGLQPQPAVSMYQPHEIQPQDSGINAMMPYSVADTYHAYQQPMTNTMGGTSTSNGQYAPVSNGYYGMEPSLAHTAVVVKEEPQTVPSCAGTSPPHSPIDMEDQERLKLERKRLRNRIAASKCRRRKLERIARLEDKVAHLKSENAELAGHVTRLREHVCQLKQQVMDHVRNGCEILVSSYPPYGDDL